MSKHSPAHNGHGRAPIASPSARTHCLQPSPPANRFGRRAERSHDDDHDDAPKEAAREKGCPEWEAMSMKQLQSALEECVSGKWTHAHQQ